MKEESETKLALTVNDVANKLSLSPQTVKRLITRSELPSFKIAGRRLVSPKALNKFIADCEAAEYTQRILPTD
jgi:excisionase family DNA binding protein